MKFKYLVTKILSVGGIFLISSCDSYLDVNENPNNPVDAPISGLMINSSYESALNVFRVGDITSNYVQYLASPNPASASDTMEPLSFNSTWFNLYNVMTDLTVLIEKSEEQGAGHYQGAAQILMALNLSMGVDIFGDMPFSESFNFETVTPAYDEDTQLYELIIQYLDDGIANLQGSTTSSLGDDDFIYGGNVDYWISFGNMLKARYMLHLSELPSYDESALLSALDNGFSSNEENADVTFFDEAVNPWFNVARNNADLLLGGWISEQFIEATDGTTFGVADPRLPLMVGATDDDEYVGTVNGAGRGDAPPSGARSTLIEGQFYTSLASPVLIATFSEQKFIEAEATFTLDKARSYQAYLDGIRAHMEMLSVPDAEIDTYINNPSVGMGVAAFTIDDIFKEKWVALFLHPEAWNDARRYDYQYDNMDLPENLNPDLNGQFIRRLAYPDNEISRNGSNVPEVTLLDRIFWDVQ
ncbi:SusD/RagB family nutrient-binding outer membrane lipoprotein [Flagellimonas marina]|uniref:SusD/RagB family nutrient-binding outer membrane lipoprotein n=1 Tax=Flagellimonas marina TaxID=1775168 RepID=A0ABV8PKR7_9FLAO